MKTSVPPYQKSATDGVWQRPSIDTFAYSDGDEVENRIASILTAASDLSVLSGELRTHITDWPSDYHLSSQRANLLRPLSQHLKGSVLEIGSGCGAITRYLGETSASVLALEGSRRRAHISRKRTRELANVEVYCDEFSAFETSSQFDAVTLIGVLEYAHMFIADEQAALRMLEKTASLLNEGGSLIIAIENQLGLKYFAGAPEDHLGIPVLGIEDKYTTKGVRTYGRQQLASMLQHAGFQSVEFLYPFPDYKMPSCVLAESAFNNPAFNPQPFLVTTAGKDPQLPSEPSFSLERAWPVIESNGLARDLSNSFLIVAQRKSKPVSSASALAWHFSTRRKQAFCKQTVFSQEPHADGINISRTLLGKSPDASGPALDISHAPEDRTPYSNNPLLSNELIEAITRSNWTYQSIADFIRTYARHLASITKSNILSDDQIDWEAEIPGEFFDCIPQNICIDRNGKAIPFDLEWHSGKPLKFLRLAFRSLWTVVGELSLIGKPREGDQVSLLELAQETFSLLGLRLTDEIALSIVQQELDLQACISGKSIAREPVWDWISKGVLRSTNAHEALAEHKLHSTNMVAHLAHVEATHTQKLESERAAHEAKLQERRLLQEQALASAQGQAEKHQNEAIQAKHESRGAYRAVRRLTRASSAQFIERKTPKNFLKQWREYQQVMRICASVQQSAANHVGTNLLTATSAYLKNSQTTLRACSWVSTQEHALTLLKRSTHWALPFNWTFAFDETQPLQSVESIAQELDIKVTLERCSAEVNEAHRIPNGLLAESGLILFPKMATRAPQDAPALGTLPDAESVRLAYIAMITDPGIAVIYIESPKARAETKTASDRSDFFCMLRPSSMKALLHKSTLLKQHVSFPELESELALTNKAPAASAGSIFLMESNTQ